MRMLARSLLQCTARTPVPAVAKVSGSDCFRYVPKSVCTMPAAASSLAVNAPWGRTW